MDWFRIKLICGRELELCKSLGFSKTGNRCKTLNSRMVTYKKFRVELTVNFNFFKEKKNYFKLLNKLPQTLIPTQSSEGSTYTGHPHSTTQLNNAQNS